MLDMCPSAWYIFIRSIQLSCFMLLCAAALIYAAGDNLLENYRMYMCGISLFESTQAILIVAVILSVIIEDRHS